MTSPDDLRTQFSRHTPADLAAGTCHGARVIDGLLERPGEPWAPDTAVLLVDTGNHPEQLRSTLGGDVHGGPA